MYSILNIFWLLLFNKDISLNNVHVWSRQLTVLLRITKAFLGFCHFTWQSKTLSCLNCFSYLLSTIFNSLSNWTNQHKRFMNQPFFVAYILCWCVILFYFIVHLHFAFLCMDVFVWYTDTYWVRFKPWTEGTICSIYSYVVQCYRKLNKIQLDINNYVQLGMRINSNAFLSFIIEVF